MGRLCVSDEMKLGEYDRMRELKEFDETKGGVQELVASGITKIPRFFYTEQVNYPPGSSKAAAAAAAAVPTIDLGSILTDAVSRRSAAERVVDASAKYGFFQVVNHGIPVAVLDEMLRGVRRFYDQDVDTRKQWYTRDHSKPIMYNSNYDLFTTASVNWRDSLILNVAPKFPNPDHLPPVCRDIMFEYTEHVKRVGKILFELVSEGLNLEANYLNEIGCSEGLSMLCHYYPPCPEPELTLAGSIHSDINFLTLLLQDDFGGLQCLCDDQWLDVPPVPGALVVNIGDLLQLITNDKLKSGLHRVVASRGGPRISVACFFSTGLEASSRMYGPIEELLSEDNPPKYRKTSAKEYTNHIIPKVEHITSALLDFKL